MKNLVRNILLICFTLIVVQLHAQDFSFSQFYEKPILRNPSLAGIFDGDIKVTAIFKNQWQSVTVPYQTGALSVEYRFPFGKGADFMTLGLQTSLDQAGDIQLKRSQIAPIINFHKSLNEDYGSYLSLAFMPTFVSSQFDITKMQFDDQYIAGSFNSGNVTQQTFNRTNINYGDLSTGITYGMSLNDKTDFYIGAALFHFNKPRIAYYINNEATTLQNKFTINAGLTTATSDINRLIFFFDYIKQGANSNTMFGGYFGTDLRQDYSNNDKLTLYLGAFYRLKDAVVPIVKLDYYKVTLGLSYDINTSQLKTASQMRGGFELSVSYRANLNIRNEEARKMKCVKFAY
jgi:type IX secretion system PorP/SprF family membrane protein